MKFLFLALVLSFSAYAETCSYEYQTGKLTWTAFKTPKKVGVNVAFDKFTIKPGKTGSVDEMLAGSTFDVDVKSLNSGDKARDAKILSFFFKKATIGGKVLSAKAGEAEVELKMNGVTQKVKMPYVLDDAKSELKLTGSVDVLNFAMKNNLASLTKACFEKHEGVTWPTVDVQLVAQLKKSCH